MAGPILRSRDILWLDGSTGRKLAMTSSMDEREAKRMFADSELVDWIGRQARPMMTGSCCWLGRGVIKFSTSREWFQTIYDRIFDDFY